MLEKIITFSIKQKLIVILFTLTIVGFGIYSMINIPVGTVPDITNNQVQIITTSTNLSTQEIEQFITAPVEMEMANLPGVTEIRSISKFGISMVTVVFEESMGTYLPGQLIAEKIKSANEIIPDNYGTPEMGPISTGLGEIYQYILDIKPGYEDDYSPMELRTIQDWIVKRRLSGINGVVEVNSWGGHLKQYEVAIDPLQLRNLDVDLLEIYNALNNNNGISGGSYIEKNMQSYFIRGVGQVKNIEDIQNIVVKSNNGIPILIKDIAKVQYGYATRYGAITANGKGETILGQVMMLKDANSKKVINAVKARVAEIQENLPEGVYINPILERGELIDKTTRTVSENLIFGALIVFLVVLLLLGNLRSALVISSMIPLSLFFTLSLMYIFGIDANLMSLGALDFGIIIDGAVIVVEFIVLRMSLMSDKIKNTADDKRRALFDSISLDGASKMMKSAIFGQIIILIVFIPILSLQGVEGKMFHPMALSFSFAIIGAMVMGLTWIPVAASLFLRPGDMNKKNISTWLLDVIYKLYSPVIRWSFRHKGIVLGAALLSLVITAILFSRIGGEFVPTLDEGDFVIQPALKTGTSLSETVRLTTEMENILIDEFPDEVDQIVCRIGAAEVPTDPMSMEEIDMIIKLHPKNNWKKANSKEQLATKFKEALSIIPGIEYEFTQPIEMRFNELITGVRSDIAIKLYGDDLDYINDKANEIKRLINDVPGASDIIVEKTTGLPQIKVAYDRQQLAAYNMDVATLNTYLSTAFAGNITGVVYEGEKRFDIVMRLQNANRTDIQDIRSLKIKVPMGDYVPLSEFANIEYTEGPAKISRDNTHRRVVVSINVLDRDLQSVVEDIKHIVDANVSLKPGYYIEYGGQFENLQNATNRLLFAVPIALLLIFIFLHFAFRSLKDVLMIFIAIPLATVGGVLALWLRDMPFSVSAGVGFIALFGIAVLNGIVLVEHLKELQQKDFSCMQDLIFRGTKDRLRPVLLTAGTDALGFLPMAISIGAGAEIQRPLATVVIGGLVTSTMLTLIALPILFELFHNVTSIKLFPFRLVRSKACSIVAFMMFIPAVASFGQAEELSLQQLTQLAVENNNHIKFYEHKTEQAEADAKSTFDLPKTSLTYGSDQNNIAENGYPLNVLGIEQQMAFPTLYLAKNKAKDIEVAIAKTEFEMEKNKLIKDVSVTYFECQMLIQQANIYHHLDSIYESLLTKAKKQLEVNDVSKLEYLNIVSKRNEITIKLRNLESKLNILYNNLRILTNYPTKFSVPKVSEIMPLILFKTDSLPIYNYLLLQSQLAESQIKIQQNSSIPDLTFNYFIGTNSHPDHKNYQGFQVGIDVPLFFGSYKNNVKSAKIAYDAQLLNAENKNAVVTYKIDKLIIEQENNYYLIKHYGNNEIPLANEIKRTALKSYELKEIDFLRFVDSYESAIKIEADYYENIFNYNKVSLEIIHFTN